MLLKGFEPCEEAFFVAFAESSGSRVASKSIIFRSQLLTRHGRG